MFDGGAFEQRKRPRDNAMGEEEFTSAKPLRVVDSFSSSIHHMKTRFYRRDPSLHHVPPHPYYSRCVLPVGYTSFCPATAIATQLVQTIKLHEDRAQPGRFRKGFYSAMQWAPNGKKLLLADHQGWLKLYNGNSFTSEGRTSGHEGVACKALAWGASTDLILSGDDNGKIKVWMNNCNLVTADFDTNQRAIREISWGPGEHKFATAGQDGSARIWDTNRVTLGGEVAVETRLEGHGGDVHTVDWHPNRAIILTGSQDRDARMWDPRKGATSHIATLSSHAGPVTSVRWHNNGYWFLTGGRDGHAKLWDLRTMKEVTSFEGHSKDIQSVAWHPSHPNLFASTGVDGVIAMWVVEPGAGEKQPSGGMKVNKWTAAVTNAHGEFNGTPNAISSLRWSPSGLLLVSSAKDCKLWTRNKPGADTEVRGEDNDETEAMLAAASA